MKKLLVLGVLVFSILLVSLVYAQNESCVDSDGGKDVYVAGITKGKLSENNNEITELFDYCMSNSILVEAYCEEDEAKSTNIDCPEGYLCENINKGEGKNGRCVAREQREEQVKCVFKNSKEEQRCDVAAAYTEIGCEGIETCIAEVKGYKGEKLTWKSSCGGYAYTKIDGENEYAEFDCTSGEVDIDEIEKNGFKNAYFQCYDGEESSSTGREACKSAEFWQKFAEQFCESHCKKKGEVEKCGVNTFSIGDECYLGEGLCLERESVEGCCERWSQENNIIKPACVGEWDIEENKCSWSCKEEEEFEPALVCKNSCPLNEKCYPFGYRKAGEYCSDEGKFVEQGEENCDNNFECKSNVCVDGKCVSSSFIQKIIEWFKRLFG